MAYYIDIDFECVKILRIFNVSTLCVEFIFAGRAGRNAAGISQRWATLSPHSARPELLACDLCLSVIRACAHCARRFKLNH